ncbi:MAG: hypothetical protein KTV77_02300 [Wolbachia endosymbiont of Fragariocoptes setiger]|nr:hypothetical protein [Wolbachia endosymbiont of Fragariocoptes setiger]
MICNTLKNDLKKVRERYTRYSKVAFESMSKAQEIIQENSNSSVLEFNEFLSTVEEKIRSCDNLLIKFMKEIDSDIESLLDRDSLLMSDESIAFASSINEKTSILLNQGITTGITIINLYMNTVMKRLLKECSQDI